MMCVAVPTAFVIVDNAPPLVAVAGSTAVIYMFLIVALRLLGRRQLGQLTVIDLVVVLVLGSAVETAMIHGNISLAAGLVSAGTLLVLNQALTWAFVRSPRLSHLVGGGPILLIHDGHVVEEHLYRAAMTRADLMEVLRSKGFETPNDVRAAVLETDGSVSVVPVDRHPG
jgi:uncharacterized membrane protein YcaP (DUF421 family)